MVVFAVSTASTGAPTTPAPRRTGHADPPARTGHPQTSFYQQLPRLKEVNLAFFQFPLLFERDSRHNGSSKQPHSQPNPHPHHPITSTFSLNQKESPAFSIHKKNHNSHNPKSSWY